MLKCDLEGHMKTEHNESNTEKTNGSIKKYLQF